MHGWRNGGGLLLVAVGAIHCGPVVPGGPAGESQSGGVASGTDAAATTISTSAVSFTTTMATSTSTPTSSATAVTSTGGTTTSPGAACPEPPPPVVPPVPEGCRAVWLVDPEGVTIEGAASGLVSCTGRDDFDVVVYRTAAVACPELIGDECLCDADCARGEACICANELTRYWNFCLPADCSAAEDCGSSPCRVDKNDCLGTWLPSAVRCTSASDDCVFDSECTRDDVQFCDYDETSELFTCDPGTICE